MFVFFLLLFLFSLESDFMFLALLLSSRLSRLVIFLSVNRLLHKQMSAERMSWTLDLAKKKSKIPSDFRFVIFCSRRRRIPRNSSRVTSSIASHIINSLNGDEKRKRFHFWHGHEQNTENWWAYDSQTHAHFDILAKNARLVTTQLYLADSLRWTRRCLWLRWCNHFLCSTARADRQTSKVIWDIVDIFPCPIQMKTKRKSYW